MPIDRAPQLINKIARRKLVLTIAASLDQTFHGRLAANMYDCVRLARVIDMHRGMWGKRQNNRRWPCAPLSTRRFTIIRARNLRAEVDL